MVVCGCMWVVGDVGNASSSSSSRRRRRRRRKTRAGVQRKDEERDEGKCAYGDQTMEPE